MNSSRWKRTRATVELCERRRRHRDGTRITPRERCRYAITLSYPVRGDLYITDVVSNRPLKEGSHLILGYDSLDPRHNTLNHPPVYRSKKFLIFVGCFAAALFLLLLLALAGL